MVRKFIKFVRTAKLYIHQNFYALLSLYRLNRLCELPRGFGSFPALEILDLTYNNLTNSSFSANFSYLGECLRALYMGDNDLTEFPPQIEKFVHLEIVSHRLKYQILGTIVIVQLLGSDIIRLPCCV